MDEFELNNEDTDMNETMIALADRKDVSRPLRTHRFQNEEERAIYVLQLLGQHRFTSAQIVTMKLFIQKWLRANPFQDLVINLAMALDKGEDVYYLRFEGPEEVGA